jgi:hypothetical protein
LRDEKHYGSIQAYRVIYFVYTVAGLIKLCLALLLSKSCEVHSQPASANPTETAPLLGDGQPKDDKKKRWRLLPDISKESRVVLVQLCVLFAFDNFASGLAPV